MAGGESLGNLYFDLGLRDDSFEASFKSKMDKYKKMELNVGVKIDSESAKKAISATTDTLKNSSKVDFSSTITPLVTRLKEARSELNVFKELMSETKNIGKKLEIRTNIKDTEKELESLMRQIKALNSAQSSLNIKTSPNSLTPSRSIQDEGSLSSMRAYYTQLEKDANNFAKAESAAAKEAVKASKDIETAKRQASSSASRDALNASKGNTELAKEALLRQKVQKEIEATALAHKRNESFGTQSQSRIRSNAEFTNKTLLSQRQIAMQLSNQFGTMFSIYAVERFVKKLADVRGEFEQQKVALRSVLQDAPKADEIFEQVKNLAVKSPFTFKELAGYTKQLSAMSIPANELFGTMKKLADVSSGLGVGMDRIVLAYGQVKAAGVLRGQELRQFSEAGINIVELLAEKFTKLKGKAVSSADVFDMISKKMVSFGMVSEIFDDMTSSGGKFYKMQEIQAETLKGMISNLTDAYELGLNSIGESTEGILKGAVSVMTLMARNMESLVKWAVVAVSIYGAYRVSLLILAAAQAISVRMSLQQALATDAATGASIKLTSAQKLQAVITSELTGIQIGLNRAISANPIGFATIAILSLVAGMTMYANSAEKSIDLNSELAKINQEASNATKNEISNLDSLRKTLNLSTSSYKDKKYALSEIQKIVPEYHASLTKEGQLINNNTKALDDYASKLVATEKIKIAAQKQAAAEEEFSSFAASNKDVLSKALGKRAKASDSGKYDNPDDVLMAGEKAALATWTRLAKNVGVYGGAIEKLRKELMQVGTSTPQVLGGSGGGDKTDYVAKNLENQIKLVKNLYSEYSKLKGVQGADRAKSIIQSDPDYKSSIGSLESFGVIPSFSEDDMNAEITKLIARTEPTKKVREIGASFASNIDKGFADKKNEVFKNIFDSIEKLISSYKPKQDLYDKILGLTGDKTSASILAFGENISKDLGDVMKEQFKILNNGVEFNPLIKPSEGASDSLKKMYDDIVNYYETKKITRIEAMTQLIEESKSSSDKIITINKKADDEIAKNNDAATELMKGKSATQILEIGSFLEAANKAVKSNSEQQINEIRSELFQLTPLYDEVFKDLGKVAAGNLDDLLAKTNGIINILRDKDKTEVQKDSKGVITGYFVKKDTIDPNTGLKIEKNTLFTVEKYNSLLERTGTIINKINENPFKALFNPPKGTTTETVEEKAKRISGAIQGISDLAQSVAGDIGNVMDSFGASSESQAALKNITQVASGAGEAGSGVAKLASGDIVGGIKGVVGGISKVITGLNAMHDAKYERQIKAYQKQIDATVKSYGTLTDALSRKTAASKVDAQAEEYILLQREKNLLESQKKAEEAKKKTDQSKIDDYNKQIEDAAKKQQELALNTISYVLGGNIGSQADSWAKTLTDAMDTAFKNGTDAAQAWGDNVHEIVRNIAKQFIVTGYLGKEIQKILEAESSNWTNPDGTANDAAINASFDRIEKKTNALEPVTEAALKAFNIRFGTGVSSSSATLSSNIKSVTEDTANRLAGMINSIRQDSAVNRISLSTMRDIMQSYAGGNIEANSYLQKMDANIRQNTLNTTAILSAIQDVTTNGANGKALKMA